MIRQMISFFIIFVGVCIAFLLGKKAGSVDLPQWFRRPNNDDYQRAALDVVCDDCGIGSVWPGASKREIDGMQDRIDAARRIVATVGDRRARRAYEAWLNFFQHRVDAARDELTTGAEAKAYQAGEMEWNERQKRARAVAATLPRLKVTNDR